MRSVTKNFFETKIRLDRVNEEGLIVKFVELYVVDALSFTECEARTTEYISQYASGEFEILTETRAAYKEVFFSDNADDTLWYKTKVDFITLDERSGKQKHSKVVYLLQASSIESAKKNIDEAFSGTMMDYKVVSLAEVPVADVILASNGE